MLTRLQFLEALAEALRSFVRCLETSAPISTTARHAVSPHATETTAVAGRMLFLPCCKHFLTLFGACWAIHDSIHDGLQYVPVFPVTSFWHFWCSV